MSQNFPSLFNSPSPGHFERKAAFVKRFEAHRKRQQSLREDEAQSIREPRTSPQPHFISDSEEESFLDLAPNVQTSYTWHPPRNHIFHPIPHFQARNPKELLERLERTKFDKIPEALRNDAANWSEDSALLPPPSFQEVALEVQRQAVLRDLEINRAQYTSEEVQKKEEACVKAVSEYYQKYGDILQREAFPGEKDNRFITEEDLEADTESLLRQLHFYEDKAQYLSVQERITKNKIQRMSEGSLDLSTKPLRIPKPFSCRRYALETDFATLPAFKTGDDSSRYNFLHIPEEFNIENYAIEHPYLAGQAYSYKDIGYLALVYTFRGKHPPVPREVEEDSRKKRRSWGQYYYLNLLHGIRQVEIRVPDSWLRDFVYLRIFSSTEAQKELLEGHGIKWPCTFRVDSSLNSEGLGRPVTPPPGIQNVADMSRTKKPQEEAQDGKKSIDREHERAANSCVILKISSTQNVRSELTKRPSKIGWARDYPVADGQKVPKPPPGCRWFSEKDANMKKAERAKPEDFDNDGADLISLSFAQVSHIMGDENFKLVPWVILDESLTMYATMAYSNKERTLYWPRNFSEGNPRVNRPIFGRGPICHVGSWTVFEDGSFEWNPYELYWPVYKRAVVLCGQFAKEKGQSAKKAEGDWLEDSYAWSFGDRIVDQESVPDLFDDYTNLNLYFTIGADRKLSNLPKDLTWKHFAMYPSNIVHTDALSTGKIPICVAELPWPLTQAKINAKKQGKTFVQQPRKVSEQSNTLPQAVKSTPAKLLAPSKSTSAKSQDANKAKNPPGTPDPKRVKPLQPKKRTVSTPISSNASPVLKQHLTKQTSSTRQSSTKQVPGSLFKKPQDADEDCQKGSFFKRSPDDIEAYHFLNIYQKDPASAPELPEDDRDRVDELMNRSELVLLDDFYGIIPSQQRALEQLEAQRTKMCMNAKQVLGLKAVVEEGAQEIESLEEEIRRKEEELRHKKGAQARNEQMLREQAQLANTDGSDLLDALENQPVIVQAGHIREIVEELVSLGQHIEATSVVQNFRKQAPDAVAFDFSDIRGLEAASEILRSEDASAEEAEEEVRVAIADDEEDYSDLLSSRSRKRRRVD